MNNGEIDTRDHIAKVEGYLSLIADLLRIRASVHDASKLQEPELSGYAGLSDALKDLTYGTPEYRAAFAPFKPIIQHHYELNTHHPEHWPGGVEDMSLLDILEMLCDWKAANDRSGGDFLRSMQISFERFEIQGKLMDVMLGTARELGWIKL